MSVYSVREPINPINFDVGRSIKDLASHQISEKRQNYLEACQKAEREYQVQMAEYNKTFSDWKKLADDSQISLPEKRRNQILSITVLALAIILVIGIMVLTALTGFIPILFALAPFGSLLVASTYYSIKCTTEVWQLKHFINLPNLMEKPKKAEVPKYEEVTDLDYKEAREMCINHIEHDSISRLAKWDFTILVNYRLLDKSTANSDKIGLFYGKVLDLIKQYKVLNQHQPKPHFHRDYHEAYQKAVNTLDSYYRKYKLELQTS